MKLNISLCDERAVMDPNDIVRIIREWAEELSHNPWGFEMGKRYYVKLMISKHKDDC